MAAPDMAAPDLAAVDKAVPDVGPPDLPSVDQAPDSAPAPDLPPPAPDLSPDLLVVDAATPDLVPAPDKGVPACAKGKVCGGDNWCEVGPKGSYLQEVHGSSSKHVVAVTGTGTIWSFDGKTWSKSKAPVSHFATSIWTSGPKDTYVVSSKVGGMYSPEPMTELLRFDGASWKTVLSTKWTYLLRIHGTGPGKIHAAGGWCLSNTYPTYNLCWAHVASYDGKVKYLYSGYGMRSGGGDHFVLSDVWSAGPKAVFAVGEEQKMGSYGTSIIQRYDGTYWSTHKPTGVVTRAVWGSGPADVHVVGGTNGARYNGKTWKTFSTASSAVLLDIWGSGPSDIYAVGDKGTIVHSDGTSWKKMASGTPKKITSVWGSSKTDVYVVAGGNLLHKCQ